MGLLFFSCGIDICAFDGTGEVEDGKHLGSEVLRQKEKAKIGSRNSGIGVVRIVNCTEPASIWEYRNIFSRPYISLPLVTAASFSSKVD